MNLLNIIWLDPMNSTITSGVVTVGSMSTLTFNPLVASHAGTYTCEVMVGSITEATEVGIIVESECH